MKKYFFVLLPALYMWMSSTAQIGYSSFMGYNGEPRQFISELSDELYSAGSRFLVTPGGLSGLFMNTPNQPNWIIPAGTAGTITINLTAKGEVSSAGINQPVGYILVSCETTQIASTVTGQVLTGGTWTPISAFTNISTTSGDAVFEGVVNYNTGLTEIQLTVTAPSGNAAYISKIEYHRWIGDNSMPISAVTKYGTNNLYAPLNFQDTNNVNRAYINPAGTAYLSNQLAIGTVSPTAQFHTTGTVRLAGIGNDNTQARLLVSDTNGNISYRQASTLTGTGSGWALVGNAAVNPSTTFIGTTDTSSIPFRTNNLERMRVAGNGNILIGRTSQVNTGYILDVNGNARINEIVINSTGADYVFDPDYHLSPLPEVEKYIHAHHHLPDISSAGEMQEQGIDVAANQTALLKKIEELTLYLIEEKKQQQAQSRQIKRLQRQNSQLLHLLKSPKTSK
jgi:hypothetical protein